MGHQAKNKQLFHTFPDILLVDATYNVDGVGMLLYCLMVEDGFGHGQMVHITPQQLKKIQNIFEKLFNHARIKTLHGLAYVSLWLIRTLQNRRC